jgi:adenylate kinase
LKRPKLIVILGPPGVGKTNPRKSLVHIGFAEIEASRAIKEVCKRNHFVDAQVKRWKQHAKPGDLLGDDIMAVIFDDALDQISKNVNLVIDGFPRTPLQVDYFFDIMAHLRYDIRWVFLNVSDEELAKRVEGRRSLESRPDDAPEVHMDRIKIWRANEHAVREAIIHHEKGSGSIIEIDAHATMEEVLEAFLKSALG